METNRIKIYTGIRNDVPMNETGLWAFLVKNQDKPDTRYAIKVMICYTAENFGYNRETCILDQDEVRTMRLIINHFWRLKLSGNL